MTNEELLAALQALLAQRPPTGGIDPLPYTDFMNGPQIVTHKGATFRLRAPINLDWEPTLTAKIFGQAGAIVRDPSNARPDQAARSPKGYPLHYTYDGRPLVAYGEHKVDNDGLALESLKQQLAEREANLRQVGGQWSPR